MNGATEGAVVSVAAGERVTFGRTSASQRSFPQDTHMSSVHFEVENFEEWAELRDKRSTNGTWLNNNRVTAERLSDGDQIRAGTTVFSVQFRNSIQASSGLPRNSQDSRFESKSASGDSHRNPVAVDPPEHRPLEFRAHNRGSGSENIPSKAVASGFGGAGQSQLDFPNASVFPESLETGGPGVFASTGGSPGNLLEDVHRHLDKKLNPFGDSIDFSEALREERNPLSMGPVPMESAFREENHLSPISDSSVIVPSAFDLESSKREDQLEHHFYHKRLNCSLADGVNTLVEVLSREYSIQVVLHPQKIRQAIPQSCQASQALWNCYSNGLEFGPVAMPWLDFKKLWNPFVARLCSADGLIFFFGDDLQKMHRRLRELPLVEIPGFSEAGGFLNCFWPSSLMVILNSRGTRGCSELFDGKMSGLLMPSPFDNQVLLAAASTKLGQSLGEIGFLTTNRLGG